MPRNEQRWADTGVDLCPCACDNPLISGQDGLRNYAIEDRAWDVVSEVTEASRGPTECWRRWEPVRMLCAGER